MDWADDVAYSVHDVEDGMIGRIRTSGRLLQMPTSGPRCARTWPRCTRRVAGRAGRGARRPARRAGARGGGRVRRLVRSLVALKRAASLLIGRFASAAVGATRDRYGAGPLCRYEADLLVPPEIRAQWRCSRALHCGTSCGGRARPGATPGSGRATRTCRGALVNEPPTPSIPCSPRSFAGRPTTRPGSG